MHCKYGEPQKILTECFTLPSAIKQQKSLIFYKKSFVWQSSNFWGRNELPDRTESPAETVAAVAAAAEAAARNRPAPQHTAGSLQ